LEGRRPLSPLSPPSPPPPPPIPVYNAAIVTHYPYNGTCGGAPYSVDEFSAGRCTKIPVFISDSANNITTAIQHRSILVHVLTCAENALEVSASIFASTDCSGAAIASVPEQIPTVGTDRPRDCIQTNSLRSWSAKCSTATPVPPPSPPPPPPPPGVHCSSQTHSMLYSSNLLTAADSPMDRFAHPCDGSVKVKGDLKPMRRHATPSSP